MAANTDKPMKDEMSAAQMFKICDENGDGHEKNYEGQKERQVTSALSDSQPATPHGRGFSCAFGLALESIVKGQ